MNQKDDIRLVLETDAIVHPLTGIGRYVLELLQAFSESNAISDLRCLSRGRWYEPARVIEEGNAIAANDPRLVGKAGGPRWRRNPARAVLRRMAPYFNQRNLEKLADSHLYHSPNYRLAPFKGRKVVTFHDLSLFLYPQYHPEDRLKLLRPAIESAAREADHLITDSQQVRREVMSYFDVPAEKITAIPLATTNRSVSVDETQRDAFLAEMGLKAGSYFLFVSTLEPRKNISGLLGAYELLPRQLRRNFPLVLSGQLGWQSREIETALHRARHRGDVVQAGYLSNQSIDYLYSGARAFVYPSFYEGFGLPILEAQAFGTPVITSDCACMPEVAGDGARVVNPESYGALATAMQSLVDDEELHHRLGIAGKANAARFSWNETAKKTIGVYQEVMSSGR